MQQLHQLYNDVLLKELKYHLLNLLRLIAGVGFGSSCDSHDSECRNEGMSKLFTVGGMKTPFSTLSRFILYMFPPF